MVIEHTFVTTLPASAAFQAAESFLAARGFSTAAGDRDPNASSGSSLEMRRGKSNPERARSIAELPQSIRLEFDRGRIALAGSITPSSAWGGRSWANTQTSESFDPKRMKLHAELLTAIASGLEKLLVEKAPADIASLAWIQAEEQIALAAKRHKRRMIAGLAIGLTVLGAIIALMAHAASK